MTSLSDVVRVLAWPALFMLFMLIWHWLRYESEMTAMLAAYVPTVFACLALEQIIPYNEKWNSWRTDKAIDSIPVLADLFHTTLTSVAIFSVKTLCLGAFEQAGYSPPFATVLSKIADEGFGFGAHVGALLESVLAILVAEVAEYWQHRCAHTSAVLWPFHAVHHAIQRLYCVNTGRFHFIDQMQATLVSFPVLYAIGFSDRALWYYSGLRTVVGVLSHSNIDTRCGWLNYIFNTPEVHRWHHSRRIDHSNSNYGENLVLIDHLFGTFCLGRAEHADRNTRSSDSVSGIRKLAKRSASRSRSRTQRTKDTGTNTDAARKRTTSGHGGGGGVEPIQLGRVRYSDVISSTSSASSKHRSVRVVATAAEGGTSAAGTNNGAPCPSRMGTAQRSSQIVRLPKSFAGQIWAPFVRNPLFSAWQEHHLADYPGAVWELLWEKPTSS